MTKTIRVAFCGAAAALEIVLLFLTNLFPTATIALPAIAGVMLMAVVIEVGVKWGWVVYGISVCLSFFLMSDKEAFLMYLLFFGYYPTLKASIEKKVRSKPVSWLIKVLVFNLAAVMDALAVVFILQVPTEIGLLIPALLLLVANVVFVVYDSALSGLVWVYWKRLHPYLAKTFQSRR